MFKTLITCFGHLVLMGMKSLADLGKSVPRTQYWADSSRKYLVPRNRDAPTTKIVMGATFLLPWRSLVNSLSTVCSSRQAFHPSHEYCLAPWSR